MKFSSRSWRRLGTALGIAALALPAGATPVIDGVKDAEYTLVGSSPKDNLLVDAVNGVDDPADPKAKAMDVTGVYAANSGNSLYFYVELPYLNLSQVYGDWAIVLHLGGANDAIQVSGGALSHPYGPTNILYGHNPAANAVIVSNFRGTNPSNEGQNGWAYVNVPNATHDGWQYPGGNYFGGSRWDTVGTLIHGYGTSGAEIVYKPGDGTAGNYGGIEMRVPFADFGGNGDLTAPKVGDVVRAQFYDTTRGLPGDTSSTHYRGAIDTAPWDEGSRKDPGSGTTTPFGGTLTVWGSYTIAAPASFDVSSANASSNTQLSVTFSDTAGAGATTAANYQVQNLTEKTTISVSAAAIDGANTSRVNLTTAPLGYGDTVRVTVTGVQSSGGVAVTPTKNTADAIVPVQVQFRLYDPKDIVTTQGIDPATTQPGQITVTGSFTGWAANGDGTINPAEVLVNPVNGVAKTYETATILLIPGTYFYKYRIPVLKCDAGCLAWDTLNTGGDPNRRVVVPTNTDTVVQTYDYTVNNSTPGEPVVVTFVLVDNDALVGTKQVQVAGSFNGWNSDPTTGLVMLPVSGKANTYTASIPIGQGYIEYKYIIKPDPIGDPTNTLWNSFGDNLYAVIGGTGLPLSQTITNVFGTPPVPAYVKALRIAGGLDVATGADMTALDKNGNGTIEIVDALRLLLNR